MSLNMNEISHHDYGAPRYYNPSCVGDLPLAVPRDTGVVSNIIVSDCADAQLGAVVEDTHSWRRLHWVGILVPQYFGRGCAICLAI